MVLSGASRTELCGKAENITINAWGASKASLLGFPVKDTRVHLSGASQASVNCCGSLNLEISGGSKLIYTGEPALKDVSVSGASTVIRK